LLATINLSAKEPWPVRFGGPFALIDLASIRAEDRHPSPAAHTNPLKS
jgi:hypothetical protein